ncbi:MAG: redoxin family protein [Rhizobiales bacterium]|nr:redoxin family protein [Hyphomicrobiales bacterium]
MTQTSPSGARRLFGMLAVAAAAAVAGYAAVYVSLRGGDNDAVSAPGAEAPVTLAASLAAPPVTAPRATTAPTTAAASVSEAGAPRAGTPAMADHFKPLLKGGMVKFVASRVPNDLGAVAFRDGEGAPVTLADWKGRVVLVNVWATWCAPCLHEMPSLDRLQKALGGEAFEVVAVSIDRGPPEKPAAFLARVGAEALKLYHDETGKLAKAVGAYGMPTTILVGRDGFELGRLVGPAEWDDAEAQALLKAAIALGGGA